MIIADSKLEQNPLVSVVICAYNRESTIAQAIDSVLAQKCTFSFEIIIGEDCGTDGTRRICIDYQKKYPKYIKLILQERNCGLGKNWSTLVKEARCKYVASCDDDDYWHNPDKLQLQVDFMEKHSDFGLLHTEYDTLNEKDNSLIKNYNKSKRIKTPEGFVMKEIFNGTSPIRVSTSLIRKELIDKYFPFEDYAKLNVNVQDWPTWIILSKYSKVGYLPISTTTFRKGHESLSNPEQYEKIEKKYAAEHSMYKYICDMFPGDLVYNENDYINYINYILLNLAYKKNDFVSAKKYANKMSGNRINQIKVRMAKHKFSFILFSILKKARGILIY